MLCDRHQTAGQVGAPSDGGQQIRLMTSTPIPIDGVHLFRAMTSTGPGASVESVDRSERPRWVILESAWPPPFSTGGARHASRETTHAEDPRGSASQGRGLVET